MGLSVPAARHKSEPTGSLPEALLAAYTSLGKQLATVGMGGRSPVLKDGDLGEDIPGPPKDRLLSSGVLAARLADSLTKGRLAFTSTLATLPYQLRFAHMGVSNKLATAASAFRKHGFGDISSRAMKSFTKSIREAMGEEGLYSDASMWASRLASPEMGTVEFVEQLHNFVATSSNSTLDAYTLELCSEKNNQVIPAVGKTLISLLGADPKICATRLADRLIEEQVATFFNEMTPSKFLSLSPAATMSAIVAVGEHLLERLDELRNSECQNLGRTLAVAPAPRTTARPVATSPYAIPHPHERHATACSQGHTCSADADCGGCRVCGAGVGFNGNDPSAVRDLMRFTKLLLGESAHGNQSLNEAIDMIAMTAQAAHPSLYIKVKLLPFLFVSVT